MEDVPNVPETPAPPAFQPMTLQQATEETPLTQKGTVVVSGTTYAVGLMWQPLQNPENPITEIRETLEAESDADLYCLRSSIAPQYGIGRKSMGHKDGMPALAASVAAAVSNKESICAIFQLEDGYYFTAIRNDLILSEEDAFFESKEDARRAFFAMMAVPDWDLKIAPKDWAVEDAENILLPDLLKRAPKFRLVELSALNRTSVLLFIAFIVLILLGVVVYTIVSWWDTVFPQEKIVALPTPEAIKPIEPIPEKPKPWEKVPQVDIFLNKCWNNSYQLNSMTIPGWQINTVYCTPNGITTSWSKSWNQAGRIAWLKSAINEYKISKVNIKIAEAGNAAEGAITFTDIPFVASVPTLTVDQIRDDLIDISQATGLRIDYQQESIVDPPTAPDGTVPPNQQVYNYFRFSIASPYTPWEWKVFFDKFSGLELLKIDYEPSISSSTKWKYEGRIYAK